MAGQILLVWWHIVWPHSTRALLHPQPSRLEVFMKTPSLCSRQGWTWKCRPQYQFNKLLNGQGRLLRKLGVSYIYNPKDVSSGVFRDFHFWFPPPNFGNFTNRKYFPTPPPSPLPPHRKRRGKISILMAKNSNSTNCPNLHHFAY